MMECPNCYGTGSVAIGPWGVRPPKGPCPDCEGTGKVYSVSECTFCNHDVTFKRIEIPEGGPFWGLEGIVPGSGSDHLATWCARCGPKHREKASA